MIRKLRTSGRTPEVGTKPSTEPRPVSPMEEPHLKGLHRVGRIGAKAAKWIAGAFLLVNIHGAIDNMHTAKRTDKKPVAEEKAEPSDTETGNGTSQTNSGYDGKKVSLTYEQREELRKRNINKRLKRPYAKKSWWWKPNWNPSKLFEDRVGRVLAAFGIIFEEPASIGAAMALSDKARNDCTEAWEEMHNATITALSETNEMSASTCITVTARNILAMNEPDNRRTEGKGEDHPWSAHFETAPEDMGATVVMAGNAQTQVTVLEPNGSASEHETGFNARTGSTHETNGENEEGTSYSISFAYSAAPATRGEESDSGTSSETMKTPGTIGQAESQTCASGKPQTENKNEAVLNPNKGNTSNMGIESVFVNQTDIEVIPAYAPPVSQSQAIAQPNQVTAQGEQTEPIELAAQTQNLNQDTNDGTTAKTQRISRAEQDAQNSLNALSDIEPQPSPQTTSSQTVQQQNTEACGTTSPIVQNMEFAEEIPVFVVSLSTTTAIAFSDNNFVSQANFIPQTQTAAPEGVTILQEDAAQMPEGLQAQETNTTGTTGLTGTVQGNASAETTTETAMPSNGQTGGFTAATSGAFSVMGGATPTGKGGGAYFGSGRIGKNPLKMSTPVSPDPEKPENTNLQQSTLS